MKLKFSDYDGPTGLYVATGSALLPIASPAGSTAFLASGLQAETIDPAQAAAIQAAVDKAVAAAAEPK